MGEPPLRNALPGWLRNAILALGAICLLGLFTTQIDDPDFWWHLRTGQYIWQQHAIPVPDPFSYTTNSGGLTYAGEDTVRQFNLTHEWLAQVILYLAYRAGGFAGIVLLRALLLAGFCGIAGFVAQRRSGSLLWGVTAAFLAASVAVNFRSDRPALITFFLVAVFFALLELRRGIWSLPILSLVWANCHSGFFLGWIVVGAYALEAAVPRKGESTAERRNTLAVVAVLTILASWLNPNHFRVLEVLRLYSRSSMTSMLIEWSKPYLWGPPYAFDLLLYAAAAVLLYSWRRVRVVDWVLFVVFAAAALMAFRNIIFVGLFAPPLLAAYFPWQRPLPRFTPKVLAVAMAAGVIVEIGVGGFFQFGAAMWRYPSGAAAFLLENHIAAPLFNTYEYGGYLIWRLWPEQRVFIDGRALNESVFEAYRHALTGSASDRDATLARFGVGAILMNAFEYQSGVLYPLALAPLESTENAWRLVYEDPAAIVLMRHPPDGMATLGRARVLDHLEAECGIHVQNNPEYPLCARTLGFLFLQNGERERARRSLNLYLQHAVGSDAAAQRTYLQLISGK
jgi:hypothetical protein